MACRRDSSIARPTCSTIRISPRAQAIVSTPHPRFGTLRMQNVAPRLSATPGSIRTPAPELGQHNDEIYRGLLGLERRDTRGASRQRRDLNETKKAGRRVRPFRSNALRIRSGVEQPELRDAHHGRVVLDGPERLRGFRLVVVAQVGDAEQQ